MLEISFDELQPKPIVFVTWDASTRAQWQIEEIPNVTSASEVRGDLGEFLAKNPQVLYPVFFDKQTIPDDAIMLDARFINEGNTQGITLLEGEDQKAIIVVAKNEKEGAQQNNSDYKNLPKLRAVLPPTAQLRIPKVYDQIQIGRPQYPAFLMEFLPGYQELSLTNFGENDFFVANAADPKLGVEQQQDISAISSQTLDNQIVAGLAKSQTAIYFALGERTQQDLRINAGDYLVKQNGENIELALITLQGGLTDRIPFDEFVFKTLTHTEPGFDIRFGSQEKLTVPFARKASQTISGIESGYKLSHPNQSEEEVKNYMKETLQKVAQQIPEAKAEILPKQNILQAIDSYLQS